MKYASRKFIITCSCVFVTCVLAYFGKMDAHVALVLSACIASYNVMQGWIDKSE